MCVCLVSQSCLTILDATDCSHFFLQGIFPTRFPALQADSLPSEPPGKPRHLMWWYQNKEYSCCFIGSYTSVLGDCDVIINNRLCDQLILTLCCVTLGYYLTFLSPNFLIWNMRRIKDILQNCSFIQLGFAQCQLFNKYVCNTVLIFGAHYRSRAFVRNNTERSCVPFTSVPKGLP